MSRNIIPVGFPRNKRVEVRYSFRKSLQAAGSRVVDARPLIKEFDCAPLKAMKLVSASSRK